MDKGILGRPDVLNIHLRRPREANSPWSAYLFSCILRICHHLKSVHEKEAIEQTKSDWQIVEDAKLATTRNSRTWNAGFGYGQYRRSVLLSVNRVNIHCLQGVFMSGLD